ASRPHESWTRDLRRGGRLPQLDGERTGRQRGIRAHGRALPAVVRLGFRVEDHRARGRRVMMLISGATLPDGSRADISIRDGRIAEIGPHIDRGGLTRVDADGLQVLPGLVDLHTHLREPGFEQSETVLSGSRAAAIGGFTAVHAMANTSPVADTAGVVEQVHALGVSAGYVDVRPIGAVTVGLEGERLAE